MRPSPSKFTNATLCEGDLVQIITPGGGGYGDPLDRDIDLVLNDVRERYVSQEKARRYYGVIFKSNRLSLEVDLIATEKERESCKKAR